MGGIPACPGLVAAKCAGVCTGKALNKVRGRQGEGSSSCGVIREVCGCPEVLMPCSPERHELVGRNDAQHPGCVEHLCKIRAFCRAGTSQPLTGSRGFRGAIAALKPPLTHPIKHLLPLGCPHPCQTRTPGSCLLFFPLKKEKKSIFFNNFCCFSSNSTT